MSWFSTRRVKVKNDLRRQVQERETIARMMPGGAPDRPIKVGAASVVEARTGNLACPQCEGSYRIEDHRSIGPGEREVCVRCRVCGVPRSLWFAIVPTSN